MWVVRELPLGIAGHLRCSRHARDTNCAVPVAFRGLGELLLFYDKFHTFFSGLKSNFLVRSVRTTHSLPPFSPFDKV